MKLDISVIMPASYLPRFEEIEQIVYDAIDEDCNFRTIEAELHERGIHLRVTGYPTNDRWVIRLTHYPHDYVGAYARGLLS